MRNAIPENIQEHSLEVAYLVHALALLRQNQFSEGRICPPPETCVLLALYHDAQEMMTGDLPTPVKYFNEGLRTAFGELEKEATQMMLAGIPESVREHYRPLLEETTQDPLTQEAHRLVKAADTLSAYIKCLDESRAGNPEFKDAERVTLEKLKAYDLPEVSWFLEQVIPTFGLTLDQLRQTAESNRT